MSQVPVPTPPRSEWRYTLVICAPPASQAWCATLLEEGGLRRLEFHDPEALAHHLRQETASELLRGLR